ncbi:MAG: hypothetical protein ACRETC_12025, partial [Gammaproteobacteria bacterium]
MSDPVFWQLLRLFDELDMPEPQSRSVTLGRKNPTKRTLLWCVLAIAAGTAAASQPQSFSGQTISTDRPGILFG